MKIPMSRTVKTYLYAVIVEGNYLTGQSSINVFLSAQADRHELSCAEVSPEVGHPVPGLYSRCQGQVQVI